MRHGYATALALMLLAAGCGERRNDAAPDANDFALSLQVEAPASQLLRLDLPAAALVAIRRADRGDIRVMDAHDRPLSMAFVDPAVARQSQTRLDAIPFNDAPDKNHSAPVSVWVDQAGHSVSVSAGGGGNTDSPERSILFDTRAIRSPAVAIALDAALEPQRPVEVTVAMGRDLKSWTPVAEQVLFRPGENQAMLGGNRIALPSVNLAGRYLRVSWSGETRFGIAGATLFTSTSPVRPLISIPAKGLTLPNAHEARFSMPPGLRPAAIRVTMIGRDGVIPLRVLGRDNAEAPWTLLAMATLRQGGQAAAVELGSGPAHFLKLEADSRSAGFSQAPSLALLYTPVTLAVAFNGDGPYRMMVGNPGAKPAIFALSELTNRNDSMGEAKVLGAPAAPTVDVSNNAANPAFSRRVVALWAALLAGVAVLAYTAFKLMRANAAQARSNSGEP